MANYDLGINQQLGAAGGAQSRADSMLERMTSVSQEAMQFQMFSADLQERQNMFNTILHAKVEGLKSLADLAKDSVQKGTYN